MKFIKYILPAMAAVGMLAACSDEPTGESTKRPAGSGDPFGGTPFRHG